MTVTRSEAWQQIRLAVALVFVIGACSTGRSTEAFCDTLEAEQARILQEFEQDVEAAESLDDPLLEVLALTATSIEALGELRSYTAKLADVAPEEIRVDAELMAEGMDKQLDAAADAASDPLGSLFGGLVDGLTYAGPTERVNQFAIEECGRGI